MTGVFASVDQVPTDAAVIVPLFEGESVEEIEGALTIGGECLAAAVERGAVRAGRFQQAIFHAHGGRPALLVIGAGPAADCDAYGLKQVFQAASRTLTGSRYSHLAYLERVPVDAETFAMAAAEGAVLGAYNEGLKKSSGSESLRSLERVSIVRSTPAGRLEEQIRAGVTIGEAANLARDLVNLPPNELTPIRLAHCAAELARDVGFSVDVLEEDAIRRLGMGALLAVAAGSDQPPRVVVMRYGELDSPVRLALVGKGLTFDSGGLAVKTLEGMSAMKADMSGAAAVLGAMVAVARLGIRGVSVTGYFGATENMSGGSAMRPGDVVTAFNGETIEILNTDCEGRLVLADLLSYAVHQGATHVVDIATLTGGATVALGSATSLAAGKPSWWVHRVVRAAERGLERAWPMPLYPEYRRAMDSTVADIKNTGGRPASPLTATAFLSDFAADARWAHLDIAGTAFGDAEPYRPKGATGVGVGTLVSLVQDLFEHGGDDPLVEGAVDASSGRSVPTAGDVQVQRVRRAVDDTAGRNSPPSTRREGMRESTTDG